ncbi:MAG: hypothetical protein OEW86_01675 [Nitrosopumilus sp.]|nr:hypothetical protein [Nitrosopumilus sp.]MDH3515811.1 hypothetical protein [Nitrosopumilus sp.]MDH5416685.1 hypothetical protein [Nitrosopumilus sp.]MDH5554419.1 hypothetical protein [Nitrosopumilus sp.]
MTKKRSGFFLFILLLSSISGFIDANAHSMFNSAESFEAGYRVQVATAPEFPQIEEPSQFLVKVTKGFEYKDVDRFTMGMRIFFNGQQVDTIPPTSIEGSHWDFDYVWRTQGNHIVKIDLYDMEGRDGIITYTFNMGTQSPFGIIFFSSIIVGALVLMGIMIYIYLPTMFKKPKH